MRSDSEPEFVSCNPARGEIVETFASLDETALDAYLTRAAEAYHGYCQLPYDERARRLREAARILSEQKASLASLMTSEMGKPIRAAVAEIEKCAWVCEHYAAFGADYLADEPVDTGTDRSWVRYESLGPVLAIMPWNFPFWQVFRFAAPALMAGNVVLLKHAPNVPRCALAMEEIFGRAGFPAGVFQNLFAGTDQVSTLLGDPRVRAASLTGSVQAGRAVAAAAGSHIKHTVLELGGSDPFIVMPSADLEVAVGTAVDARIQNSGQSCIAAKRFLVAEAVADEFEARFVDRMEGLRVGDPTDETVDVGPLAKEAILIELERQVEESVAAGARVLTGGRRLDGPGWHYPPTVLADVPRDCPASREELFGPVAALFRVRNLDEAIERANDTAFGLGAAAWTSDEEEQQRFVDELEAGSVFINTMVASDPRLPFGGVKESGFGRELGQHGIREFVNVKTVSVRSR
jgi:succinate-semialdehyde dehydrogenase/glutarate-semialdehyde dehydrogenase